MHSSLVIRPHPTELASDAAELQVIEIVAAASLKKKGQAMRVGCFRLSS